MKQLVFILSTAVMLLTAACSTQKTEQNPLLSEFKTLFGVPPFEQIKPEHFTPAFEEGMRQHNAEIEAIVNNSEAPTFENTLLALEYSGKLLGDVSRIFYNTNSANTSDEIQAVAREVAPKLSQHSDNIAMNASLYARIKEVYLQKESLGLAGENLRLLEETYKQFVRNGADLDSASQARLREINQQLALLTLKFGENVLAENNTYQLVVDNQEDLAGLPASLIEVAAKTAKDKGQEGKWIFTLHNPSVMPFLQYNASRDLRKKLQQAYVMRCNNNDERDNKDIIKQVVDLRIERAALLGYPDHASYVLTENMAKTPARVFELLDRLWPPTMKVAKTDAADLQRLLQKDHPGARLEAWDWRYYAEKVRAERYNLDEEQTRPYFRLENVRDGIFDLCNRLWGIKFVERTDLPKPHPDGVSYEVTEADGKHIGILYMDFHPRASKRSGAWMSSYREQYRTPNGTFVAPVVTLNCNFTPATSETPSLLTFDEVETFFHEFGHGLHGLLSDVTYPSLSGTNVPRDFVELPSQIMEHWAGAPEFLKLYAKHYQTGESIPDELIEKMQASATFNQGFTTGEFLASAFLDMDYHILKAPMTTDAYSFELNSMTKIGLINEILPRHRSTYFQHIFSGGYSAGYYSYIWSAVLDADAFEAFRETNIFDTETAARYRRFVLARGGTEDPMSLYVQFRGREPKIDALLKVRGLN